ncbi:MAG TPA: hypothetical protein PKA14_26035, partial [Leptospiraceae bacterium]|nr:hypothetical protein [Leptospiraceae bacterium]
MNTNNENAPNTDAISAHPYKDAISAVKRGLLQGMGIALGFFGTTVFAVAVTGTIKTWTSGEVLKSADLNTTIASLKTAIEGITSSQWTTGGSNISYTNGNVGIGTSSPTTKVDVVASYAASFRGSSSSTDIDGGFFGIGVSSFSDQTGVIRFFDSAAQGSTNEFFVIKNSAAGSSPTAGLLNIKNSSGSIFKAQFNGNITIPGALSKGSGTFDIAHPDPSMPKNSRLRHSFVESPTAGDNIYRWQIKVTRENGKFFIRLPKYWTHLNTNPMVWVSSADQPAVSFGYVDMKQEKVIVQADRTGTYNVLLLGTRKDSLAA